LEIAFRNHNYSDSFPGEVAERLAHEFALFGEGAGTTFSPEKGVPAIP